MKVKKWKHSNQVMYIWGMSCSQLRLWYYRHARRNCLSMSWTLYGEVPLVVWVRVGKGARWVCFSLILVKPLWTWRSRRRLVVVPPPQRPIGSPNRESSTSSSSQTPIRPPSTHNTPTSPTACPSPICSPSDTTSVTGITAMVRVTTTSNTYPRIERLGKPQSPPYC